MASDIAVCINLERILSRKEIISLFPSKVEFEKLELSVKRAKTVLIAVESGEEIEHIEGIKGKLHSLVTLLYQADDLLDLIITCANRTRLANKTDDHGNYSGWHPKSGGKKVVSHCFYRSNLFVSPTVMAWRDLKKISQCLEVLVQQLIDEFQHIDLPDGDPEPPHFLATVKYLVLGRDHEKERIIKMLLRTETGNKTNVTIIPIVGLSGSGKSTLAQMVYDDEMVQNHFDLRMWISVSQIRAEKEIIQEIVQSFTNRKSIDRQSSKTRSIDRILQDLLGCQSFGKSSAADRGTITSRIQVDVFEHQFQKEIDGKLYLLVLDDACIKYWSYLKDLLSGGARGSQVLVTTRSLDVAHLAKTENVQPYNIKGLSSEASLSLFKRLALRQDELIDHDMEEIAKCIVDFCHGIPLSIRVAGCLLHGKSKDIWNNFRSELNSFVNESTLSTAHEKDINIMNYILQISYNHLSPCLKACFSYCSLFPQNFDINKHDLIGFWIAQGFVNTQHEQSLEEAAEMYFLELLRLYFHDARTDDIGNIVSCKMHPIIHDFAYQNAAGIVNMDKAYSDASNHLESTCKHVSLSCEGDSSGVEFHDLGIEVLPSSISKLSHLRYLDLSKNDCLVILPKSITKLYNLQTLKLNSCSKLRRLPSKFDELMNLKRFEVDECDSLTCMPFGIEKLTQLETLSRFVVGKDCSKDIHIVGLNALKELKNLRGRLAIELTGDWMANIDEGLQAELWSKDYLTELRVNWTQSVSDVEKTSSLSSEREKVSHKELLNHLQPNSNLKMLCIEGYKGVDFPSWAWVNMQAHTLPNLVVVRVEGCDSCEHLPPFGELPALKRLSLGHMPNLQYIESKTSAESSAIIGPSPPFFKSLEELTIHNFYKLEGWRNEVMVTSRSQASVLHFPSLSKLRIWNCPKLTYMPLFSWSVTIDLRNVNQKLLEECAKTASTATWLRPMNYSGPQSLQIRRCPKLKSFTAVRNALGGLPFLQLLVVEKCDALTSFAEELGYLSSLERLEISRCKVLNLSDEGNCKPEKYNTSSWVSLRTRLHFGHINRDIPKTPWLSLKSLQYLTLRQISKMETLPEGLKHVQTLKFLWISACNALISLPEWIGSLKELQHLGIVSCPALKKFPHGIRELKSLVKVEIAECPDLLERCRENTGEDWDKIKHARVVLHKSWGKSWRYEKMSHFYEITSKRQQRM